MKAQHTIHKDINLDVVQPFCQTSSLLTNV